MRKIKYLSPTAIDDFGESGDEIKRSEFYLKRMANNRPPRLAQTHQMAVGAGFDAYVKSYLHERLYGNAGKVVEHKITTATGEETKVHGPEFDLELLFQVQVEPHNREQVWIDAERCLEMYRSSGAMSDLLIEIKLAQGDVRFEVTVEANVSHECMVCEVPLLGKPDLMFPFGDSHAIFDWKVNGYYAKSMKSPEKGYIKCRDAWKSETAPPSRGGAVQVHKNCFMKNINGLMINSALPFENVNAKFARQLTIYGWVMGVPVGAPLVIGIEQLCGKPFQPGKPLLRIASHRGMCSQKYQFELALQISKIWETIQSGHIFDWMTRAESDAKCAVLDDYYKMYDGGDDPLMKWFSETTRHTSNY